MNLSGVWIGHYQRHFDQTIMVEHDGPIVRAVKVTGDEFIPDGAPTWEVNFATKEAKGHISEMEYRNPRTVPGRIKVISDEKLEFTWIFGNGVEETVEFRKDE